MFFPLFILALFFVAHVSRHLGLFLSQVPNLTFNAKLQRCWNSQTLMSSEQIFLNKGPENFSPGLRSWAPFWMTSATWSLLEV